VDNLFDDNGTTDFAELPSEDGEAEAEAPSVYDEELPISGEPQPIAQIIDVDTPSPIEHHLTSTVCDVCLELNLTTKSCICCERCEQAFCLHFASMVDARYCVNCLSDISMTKQVITKEYVHHDGEHNITTVYRRRAREVKINGMDWLFAQRQITDMSDMELDLKIEYHRNILSLLISEQENRRNAKMHRYAGIKAIPTPNTTTVSSSTTTTTTTKKVRTVSKTKQQEQLAALLKSITAKGTSIADLAAMLKKGGK
jgi:hypothetical protein